MYTLKRSGLVIDGIYIVYTLKRSDLVIDGIYIKSPNMLILVCFLSHSESGITSTPNE